VLVIEDNDAARLVLQEAGRSLGWNVDAVARGEQALDLYRATPQPRYDVWVVDWRMPGLSGLETIAQLVTSLQGGKVPAVVMVTSYDRDELMADPLSHYADVVAAKPMTASSLFNVVVEAKAHHGLLKQRVPVDAVGQRLAGIRVMVVDDSEINRDVALDILESEGAHVDMASDGAEALIRLSSDPGNYDLVLMDVQMPVMDGYEATRQIRLHPLLSHLPVVALTAGALKNQQETALQRGMDACVPKPFEVEHLLSTAVCRQPSERASTPGPAGTTTRSGSHRRSGPARAVPAGLGSADAKRRSARSANLAGHL
jgi:CheY-like chemotaxis protein